MKTINVELNVDNKEAVKSVNDLEQELEQLREEFGKVEIGSKEFQKLGNQIKKTEAQIKDIELQFESLDKEQRIVAVTDTFAGLAGTVEIAVGAFAALGIESEALEDVEKRVIGLIAVVQGFQVVGEGFISFTKLTGIEFKNLGAAIKTTFTTGTVAARTFKIALASLGIGLVVAGITALIENFDKLFPTVKTTAEELGYTNEEFETLATNAARNTTEVNLLVRAVTDQTKSEKERREALDQLNKKYPNYFGNLTQDINDTATLTRQKDKLIDSLIREARVRAAQDKIEEIAAKNIAKRIELQERLSKAQGEVNKANAELNKTTQGLTTTQKDFTVDYEAYAELLEQNPGLQEKITKASGDRLKALNGVNEVTNELQRLNQQELEDTKFLTTLIDEETAAIAANGGATSAQTTATTKNTEAKKENVKVTKEQLDLEKGRRDALAKDVEQVEERYAQSEVDLLERLDANLITQQTYDDLALENEIKKIEELIRLQEFYGLSSTDLQKQLLEARIKLYHKDAEEVEKTEEVKENALLARLQATQSILGNISGLFKEGTDAAKAAALAEIAINTSLGFVQGLDIAQKGAKATGPLAPYSFPIFYASQIAAVLGAVSKAKTILGTAGKASTSAPTTGGTPQTFSQGAPGGIFDTSTTPSRDQEIGAIKTYVLAGDVTSAQQASRRIQQRRTL